MNGQAATFMHHPHTPHARVVDEHAPEAERQWAVFTHLVGLLSLLDFMVLGLIGAVIMWRVRRLDSPFLDDHGREAVNFQITLLIYTAIAALLIFVTLGIAAPFVLIGLFALRIVGCVRGATAAHRGEFYRYPMTFRFV